MRSCFALVPGGVVHSYGLAASQVERLRGKEGLTVTVSVDQVAASGGYLMAALGHQILAAPSPSSGALVWWVPNVHRLLKKNDVDVEVLTAGEYKRTLTVLGEYGTGAQEVPRGAGRRAQAL